MVLMILGLNYQTAPINIRERLAFDFEAGARVAHSLMESGIVTEAVLISTCNRTELYCIGEDISGVMRYFIGHCGLILKEIEPYTYSYGDIAAIRHLMKVASGLDSMILGEAEILGQVKKAYTAATNMGSVGKYLGRLFQTTFAVAKHVRTHTGIGVHPVSVAYAAARLSQHIFSDLTKITVLLVGAGNLIRLTLQHLVKMGVKKILVANRTECNGKRLAMAFGGEYFGLEKISERLAEADMVITGTGSASPIINKKMVERALMQRKRRPMYMVDLSVPRDIDPVIDDCDDIYLYCIDDLQNLVEENRRIRSSSVSDAEAMIGDAADDFMNWINAQESFKLLNHFRHKFEKMRDELLEENLHRLNCGDVPSEVLQKFAHSLTNRFLHEPTRRLRMAGLSREEPLLALTRELFELNHESIDSK